jgi:hypothetical protein
VTTRRCQRVSVRQLGPTGNHQRSWRLYSALFCSPARGRDLRDHDGDLVVGIGMHGWGQEVADSSGMLKELPPGRADQCPIWGAEPRAATLTTHLPPPTAPPGSGAAGHRPFSTTIPSQVLGALPAMQCSRSPAASSAREKKASAGDWTQRRPGPGNRALSPARYATHRSPQARRLASDPATGPGSTRTSRVH